MRWNMRAGGPTAVFDLLGYMASFHRSSLVNCYDQAYGVMTFASMLGARPSLAYTELFGYLNEVDLIGVGKCNNPFFATTSMVERVVATNGTFAVVRYWPHKSVVCDVDDEERTLFGNHMYVLDNGNVFDGCAGPHLGGWSRSLYLTNTIDHSTLSERASVFFLTMHSREAYSVE